MVSMRMISVFVKSECRMFLETLDGILYNVLSFFAGYSLTRCGRKISTKRMVPISMNAAKSPRSRNAGESSGTRLAKAPTVVTLPMSSGGTISLSTSRCEPP